MNICVHVYVSKWFRCRYFWVFFDARVILSISSIALQFCFFFFQKRFLHRFLDATFLRKLIYIINFIIPPLFNILKAPKIGIERSKKLFQVEFHMFKVNNSTRTTDWQSTSTVWTPSQLLFLCKPTDYSKFQALQQYYWRGNWP